MKNRKLEKRYKGLHYEVGCLPDGLVNLDYFWNLPHDFRRNIFRIYSSFSFRNAKKLISILQQNSSNAKFKQFRDTRSIFVHIPKSAGTSVSLGLYGRKTGDHRTIADYKLCFTKSEFQSFFKFAFVRNPWDRLYSAYAYLKRGGRNKDDHDWSARFLSPYENFEEFVVRWVNEENIRSGLHFRPQYEFLCTKNSAPEVDHICYYENIHNDYEFIRNRIGIGSKLTAANKTSEHKDDYRRHYCKKTKEIVESAYREDIRIFGYDFENTSLQSRLTNRSFVLDGSDD